MQVMPLMVKYAAFTGMILSHDDGGKQWKGLTHWRKSQLDQQEGAISLDWVRRQVEAVPLLQRMPLHFQFPMASTLSDRAQDLSWKGRGRDWVCGAEAAPSAFLKMDWTTADVLAEVLEEGVRRVMCQNGFVMHCQRAAVTRRSAEQLYEILCVKDDGCVGYGREILNGYSVTGAEERWKRSRALLRGSRVAGADLPTWVLPGAPAHDIETGSGTMGLESTDAGEGGEVQAGHNSQAATKRKRVGTPAKPHDAQERPGQDQTPRRCLAPELDRQAGQTPQRQPGPATDRQTGAKDCLQDKNSAQDRQSIPTTNDKEDGGRHCKKQAPSPGMPCSSSTYMREDDAVHFTGAPERAMAPTPIAGDNKLRREAAEVVAQQDRPPAKVVCPQPCLPILCRPGRIQATFNCLPNCSRG